ncbi:MAG: EndoU domain-containing protein [Bacteroidetes bacterium]|jgi:hypothetical protein|nr:EndoU domain-containing protein [Bacteroidota bacterium]
MASAAAILYGGQVVKVGNLSGTSFHYQSGFLMSFILNKAKYTYCYPSDFRIDDQGTKYANGGYIQEAEFLKYLADPKLLSGLSAYRLKSTDLANAEKGDIVNVHTLYLVSPYTDFCKYSNYTWTYDPDVTPIDGSGNIIFPSGTPPTVPVSLNVNALSFYNHNIGLINSSDYTDDKDQGAYYLALCALEINMINRDIFPLFNQSTDLQTYILNQNAEWSGGTIFNQPTLEDIMQYYESLRNFYRAAYANQLFIAGSPANTKVFWLASVLSANSLSVFPIDLKLTILSQVVDIMTTDYENDAPSNPFLQIAAVGPEIILNIVDSITIDPTQSDYFLKQLLNTKYSGVNNSDKTLFETLYDNLSDNRIGHLTHNLINTTDQRKQFIQSLHNIWKISKYNPYYNSPSYTQSVKPTGVYPESFFVVNRATYYDKTTAPAILVYQSTETTLSPYITSFEFDLSNNQVIASKVTQETIHDEHTSTSTTSTKFGTYHLYQPLSLIGYTSDPLVHLPQTNCIPAFFLYYASDAREIANFDYGVLLFVEIALNFATLGGLGEVEAFTALADVSEIAAADVATASASNVAELSYLSEISDIADVGSLSEGTPIVSWNTVVGISKIVQFSAGSFTSITNYMVSVDTTMDQNVKDFINKLDVFLGLINLATLGVDTISQISLATAARDIVDDATYATADLSQTAKNEIEIIADIQELVTDMNAKLQGLSLSSSNTLLTKFANLNEEDQLSFFNNFYFKDEADPIWNQLNEVYDTASGRTLVDDWEEIQSLKSYRNNIDFLSSYRYISKDTSLLTHIFEGEINQAGNGVGVHSIEAINNGKAQINSIINPANSDGYYKATVSVLDNGVPIVKPGFSTFFKDTWDRQRIIEEISLSFTNKVFIKGKIWEGTMTDGNLCRLIILSGNTKVFDATTIIKTSYPFIIF